MTNCRMAIVYLSWELTYKRNVKNKRHILTTKSNGMNVLHLSLMITWVLMTLDDVLNELDTDIPHLTQSRMDIISDKLENTFIGRAEKTFPKPNTQPFSKRTNN